MGLRQSKTAEQIERSFRRENCRITLRTIKLISRGYRAGYLRDYEFNVLLSYLYSVKTRQDLYPDQALINAIGSIHDILVQTIQERRLDWDLSSLELNSSAPTAPPSEDEESVHSESKPAVSHPIDNLAQVAAPTPNLYPRL